MFSDAKPPPPSRRGPVGYSPLAAFYGNTRKSKGSISSISSVSSASSGWSAASGASGASGMSGGSSFSGVSSVATVGAGAGPLYPSTPARVPAPSAPSPPTPSPFTHACSPTPMPTRTRSPSSTSTRTSTTGTASPSPSALRSRAPSSTSTRSSRARRHSLPYGSIEGRLGGCGDDGDDHDDGYSFENAVMGAYIPGGYPLNQDVYPFGERGYAPCVPVQHGPSGQYVFPPPPPPQYPSYQGYQTHQAYNCHQHILPGPHTYEPQHTPQYASAHNKHPASPSPNPNNQHHDRYIDPRDTTPYPQQYPPRNPYPHSFTHTHDRSRWEEDDNDDSDSDHGHKLPTWPGAELLDMLRAAEMRARLEMYIYQNKDGDDDEASGYEDADGEEQ